MGQTLTVLLIEDNPEDEYLIRRLLADMPRVHSKVNVVRSFEDAADALGGTFDVCLMDYDLGAYSAVDLLGKLPVDELTGPVVLLTGHEDIAIDQAALDVGVSDYITKSNVSAPLLDRTLRYSRRQFEDQRHLSFLAHHDALTRLLNRHAFLAQVTHWLNQGICEQQDIYMLYIDLDGFKAINDNWGHDIGDAVLKHTAGCLFDTVRHTDLIARYGGDEMVAAVANVERGDIGELADKLLAAIRRPFHIEGNEIVITASIGITRASQAPDDPLEMVRLADHAMFAAKRSGRDTFQLYSSDVPVQARKRASMEADLRNALENDELHLVFQPQIDLKTGEVVGAEALARWNHPQRGPISPGTFVPLAEECGLIRQLTAWSLDAALSALRRWKQKLPSGFRLSVNISPAQLLDSRFSERLKSLLSENENTNHLLRLEITESFFLHETASRQLLALRDANVSIALDDFGTGYSSLSQLATLPIDTLKIDMTFVKHMVEDQRMSALTQTIIAIADNLNMSVIAEGVESEEQATQLADFGCPIAQGFLYAAGELEGEFFKRLNTAPAIKN